MSRVIHLFKKRSSQISPSSPSHGFEISDMASWGHHILAQINREIASQAPQNLSWKTTPPSPFLTVYKALPWPYEESWTAPLLPVHGGDEALTWPLPQFPVLPWAASLAKEVLACTWLTKGRRGARKWFPRTSAFRKSFPSSEQQPLKRRQIFRLPLPILPTDCQMKDLSF